MNLKKSLQDVLVLVIICAVFAVILAATNSVTAPIIEDRLNAAANEAYFAVMPDAKGFEDVDLSTYTLPATVKEAKRETGGQGYAIKLETKGYASGLVIIVGISSDGVVTGATCIASNETYGKEVEMGEKVVGSNVDTIVDVEAGATSLTINGYRSAVKDALNTAIILGGGSVDIRTEEEKFADALNDALPAGEKQFTKVLLLSAIEGIDSVYEADNGQGYVCVIGTDSTGIFIGVGADGVAVGEVSAEHKALAEAAIASVKANETVDVDLSEFADNSLIANYVNYVKKTGAGSYLIELKAYGYNSNDPIVVLIVIGADGKVVDAQTVENHETENIGGAQLQDGKFNANFIGKTGEECGSVDTVSGATMTTSAFKQAVINAFNVVTLLEGGEVDTRTEAEIFQDNLEEALPAANGEFERLFMVESVVGIDSIYAAKNGEGYVCLVGQGNEAAFIGVDKDGAAITETTDENKANAEAAIALISATEISDVDLAAFNGINKAVVSVQKTATGNYIVEIKCSGFGIYGDEYCDPSGKPFYIKVAIAADGKILDAVTTEENETPDVGGVQLADGKYNSNFIGKTEAEANEVDTIAGITLTTNAFKQAILRAFATVTIIEGGAENE